MQNFTDIPSTRTLSDSLSEILNNDKTAISCSSGTAFPTANLQHGMLCFRTDQNKLYILKATSPSAVWVEIMDVTASSGKAPNAEAVDGIDGAAVMLKSNNLSDVANAATARSNIGALAKNGDTMTGNFTIQKDVPELRLRSNGGTNKWYIGANISDSVDGGIHIGKGEGISSGSLKVNIDDAGNVSLRAGNQSQTTHTFGFNEGGGEITLLKSDGSNATLIDNATGTTRFLQLSSTGDCELGIASINTTGAIRIKRAGYLDGIVMDSSGRVTTQQQPAFYAGKSNGDWTGTCLFNDVKLNTGGHYNSSTGRFTAPVSGRYLISANSLASINNSTGHKFFAVRRNGASIANVYTYVTNGQHAIMTTSFVYELVAGDYIDVTGQDGAFYGASTLNTNFSAYLLG
jgi:hypothetical protein